MKTFQLTDDRFDEFFELIESMISESEFNEIRADKEQIKLMTLIPKGVVYLAESNGKLIGFIAGMVQRYFFSLKERVTDMGFYVAPTHRGSSAAIRLIGELEDWSIKQGISDIYIGQTTAVDIEKTQRFYSHLGYKTVGFNTVKHLN
jgi:GNAT superfamily N-acetyltransferase